MRPLLLALGLSCVSIALGCGSGPEQVPGGSSTTSSSISSGGGGGAGGTTTTTSTSTTTSGPMCTQDVDCAALDDGDRCNGVYRCQDGGTCAFDPSSVVVCDQGGAAPCSAIRCDPPTGSCVSTEVPDGTWCDDGKVCTLFDACFGGQCRGQPVTCPLSCQVCVEATGSCEPSPGSCIVDGYCWNDGAVIGACTVCDSAASPLSSSNAAAGVACASTDPCYVTFACDGVGVCQGATPVTPPAPAPWAPRDGALTGSLWAAAVRPTLRPTFRWHPPGDGCSLPPTYDLQVDDSCPPQAFQSCTFPSPEIAVSGAYGNSFQPGASLPVDTVAPVGRRYYWRVRACRDDQCSAWSRVRYLDVGRAPHDLNGDGYSDLAVGTPLESGQRGAAWIYHGSPTGIGAAPDRTLTSPTPTSYGNFGFSMAFGDVDGDGFADLAVSATGEGYGNIYLYRGSSAGIAAPPSAVLPNPVNGYVGFGSLLNAEGDLDGDGYADLATLGAHVGPVVNSVAIDVYRGSPAGLTTPALELLPAGTGNSALFMATTTGEIRMNGDVDGDAFPDLVAGISHEVTVFRGGPAGPASAPTLELSSPAPSNTFAAAISVGDVYHTGYADAVVCGDAGFSPWDGLSYLYRGGPSLFSATPQGKLLDPSATADDSFGLSSALADVYGDGRDTLIVGAPYYATSTGIVYVYRGSGGGLPAQPTQVLMPPSPPPYAAFGSVIRDVGDLDGDGHADLAISAPCLSGAPGAEGLVHVYLGSPAGLPATPSRTLHDPLGQQAQFGSSIGR